MIFDEKPYDQNEVDSIKRVLVSAAEDGRMLCFEVKLDNRIIIHETTNLARFDTLYDFVNENSKKLVICIGTPNTKYKEWYTFLIGSQVPDKSMNGVKDVDTVVNEKMMLYNERAAAEKTLEKLKATEEQLEQANEYIELLTTKLEELKLKPNHFGAFDLGKFTGSAVSEFVRNYPKALDKIPVLNGLARALNENGNDTPAQETQEGGMSFKVKNKESEKQDHQESHSTNGSPDTQEDDENLAIAKRMCDFLSARLTPEQLVQMEAIISTLSEHPEHINTVTGLLDIEPEE